MLFNDVPLRTRRAAELANVYCRLRARRALMLFNDFPFTTRRVLLPWTLYSLSALVVLKGTQLNGMNAILALN